MQINYNKISGLNSLVRALCFSHQGWIVGGGALWLLDLVSDTPRDFDILIPFYTWGDACKLAPKDSKTNSHGGIKLTSDDTKIDMWAGDVGWFLSQIPTMPAYAVNPKFMTYLTVDKAMKRVKDA